MGLNLKKNGKINKTGRGGGGIKKAKKASKEAHREAKKKQDYIRKKNNEKTR